MIDYLRGKIAHIDVDYIVVDVNGMGYRVFCSNPYIYQKMLDQEQTVYIHQNVREDAIFLFGFLTREEQTLFRKLIEVSGIGPRVAIGILSGSQPESIVAAVQQENINFLIKLPGIGKKTAQRMILDLKDKLDAIEVGQVAAGSKPTGNSNGLFAEQNNLSFTGDHWIEAKQALVGLGYTELELNRCWVNIKSKLQDSDTVDAVIKLALQALYKG